MTNLFKFMSDLMNAMDAGEPAPQSDHDEPLWVDIAMLIITLMALISLGVSFQ